MDPDRRRRYQRRLETFIGVEHSPTSATGIGWERTPWHATQRAAWEALNKQRRAIDDAIREKDFTYRPSLCLPVIRTVICDRLHWK
jgi:hypothetical protein